MELAKYNKAIVAAVVGLLNVLAMWLSLSSDGVFSNQDMQIVVYAVIVALGGSGAVWAIPNKK